MVFFAYNAIIFISYFYGGTTMKDLISAFDKLPKIVKFILALPGLDVVWAVYRIVKGIAYKNYVTLIAGLVWLFAGWAILWIIDLVSILLKDSLFFAEA